MVYRGTIHNGPPAGRVLIELENGPDLPDGTVVDFELIEQSDEQPGHGHARLMKLAGVIKDKPADWARNHDHYLHGARVR